MVGMADFTYMTGLAQNFYAGALGALPISHAGIPGSINVIRGQQLENTFVTRSNVTDVNVGSGSHREENNFLLYAGHGGKGSLFLGLGGSYGYILPDDLKLGAANTASGSSQAGAGAVRWFWANSCSAFDTPGSGALYWSPAFRGLKAMLGFGSITSDFSGSLNMFQEFWYDWTHAGYSLGFAFAESQRRYEEATHKGVIIACLSAPPNGGKNDYCRESFQDVDMNKAENGAAVTHVYVVGTPVYEQ
ncbi:MAG: hypothetical protein JWO30_1762 [Fibrobacteres bacterium]|nr:hypothetical protein [Fibrobacterota bacterium]